MVQYLTEGLGIKTIGFITSNIQFQLDSTTTLSELLAENGVETVINQIVEAGTEDFYPAIAKIREADPDVVYMSLAAPDSPAFVKQRMELDYPVQLVSLHIAAMGAPGFKAMGQAAKGIIENTILLPPEQKYMDWEIESLGLDMEEYERFITDSLAIYGLEEFSTFQAIGYAYMTVLADAMQRAGTVGYKGTVEDGQKLIDAMEATDVRTAKGRICLYPDAHYYLESKLWVRFKDINEETGEFAFETLAGSTPIDTLGKVWKLYVHKDVNIADIRAGLDPNSANYGVPY